MPRLCTSRAHGRHGTVSTSPHPAYDAHMATRRVGILTAGGDSPGLNATIRGFGKAAIGTYGFEVVGFRDGFRGLAEDRTVRLDKKSLAGILTVGGTILGTSRDKPSKMLVDGELRDMTDAIHAVCKRHGLEGVVCLGDSSVLGRQIEVVGV